MTDDNAPHDDGQKREADRAIVREWARKTFLRENMHEEAPAPHELDLLDDRLARWTTDRQIAGELPPEWELRGQYSMLEQDFRSGHEEARPILSPAEIIDVDASRSASALRDYIEAHRDHAPGVKLIATRYAVTAGYSELDARKKISERFDRLFGCSVTEYAYEHKIWLAGETTHGGRDSLFPPELGWERYEPSFRRMAMHDAKFYVDRQDGLIGEKEFHEGRKYREAWAAEQRRQEKLPGLAEMAAAPVSVQDTLLPFQKQFGRKERYRRESEDGAYWRRVDEMAGYVKGDIESERRYARQLEDYAVNHATNYDKRADQMMRDIEQRFTLLYLHSPSEYLEKRLEADMTKAPDGPPAPDFKPDHTRGKGRTR